MEKNKLIYNKISHIKEDNIVAKINKNINIAKLNNYKSHSVTLKKTKPEYDGFSPWKLLEDNTIDSDIYNLNNNF